MAIAAVTVSMSTTAVESLTDEVSFIGALLGVTPSPFEIMAKFVGRQRNRSDVASLENAFGIDGLTAGAIPGDDDFDLDRLMAATLRGGRHGETTGEKKDDEGQLFFHFFVLSGSGFNRRSGDGTAGGRKEFIQNVRGPRERERKAIPKGKFDYNE